MKLHVSMLISAEDTLHTKLGALMEIVKSFGQTLLIGLRLKPEDKVNIINFNFHPELETPQATEQPVKEEKVVKLDGKKENFKGVKKPANK